MTTARPVYVLGAGLSGSLLVQALARRQVDAPVVLVDCRPDPDAGRAWAAFQHPEAPWGHRRIHHVEVVTHRGARRMQLARHVYAVVDGAGLASDTDAALARLGGHRLTAVVEGVRTERHRVLVVTSAGDFEAERAFDSTPPTGSGRRGSGGREAWMHFLGWRVTAQPGTFDPDTVTLMDFRVPQRGQLRFAYVLPAGEREALVELTAVSSEAVPPSLADDLRDHVDRIVGGRWTLVGQESGRSSLRPRGRPRRHGRVLDIGARGGLLRASTGYGLHLMAADADRVAESLARGRTPRGLRTSVRYRAMDAAMLRLMIRDPVAAAATLQQMFTSNPIDRVVGFLDSESSWVEDLRLALTLPFGPVLGLPGRAAARDDRLGSA